MENIRFLSLFVLIVSGLLFRPQGVFADDSAETLVKVDKGDVVWSIEDGEAQQIYFSSYQSGKSGWSEPVKVTNDFYRNGHPVIDAGKSGKRMLVWTAGSGSDYIIRYSVGKDDTWSEPESIPSQLQENLAPSVVIDKSGATWVVWSANDGGQDEIYFAKYSGSNWTIPMRVNSGNDVPDFLPVIALNAKGTPEVTWQGYRHDTYVQLQSTWNGEGWSEEIELEAASEETEVAEVTEETSTETATNASIANMPSFIEHPEHAFLRVYKSSIVK